MWFDDLGDAMRVLVLGAASYAVLVIVLRVSGKRTLAKLNAFDLDEVAAVVLETGGNLSVVRSAGRGRLSPTSEAGGRMTGVARRAREARSTGRAGTTTADGPAGRYLRRRSGQVLSVAIRTSVRSLARAAQRADGASARDGRERSWVWRCERVPVRRWVRRRSSSPRVSPRSRTA
jgi:hypothetical protein